MATQKELETEIAALRKQLEAERGLTDQTTKEWQAQVETITAELAALQKAAQEHEATLKAACPPPESPISVNWNMIGKHDEQFQITLRAGVTGEIIVDVMKARSEFLDVALKGGYKFPEKPKPAQVGADAPAGQNGQAASYYWKQENGALAVKKGKMILVLRTGASEPNELLCPQHGKTMKRRTNDNGSWLSHKISEDSYCSAVFEHEA